METLAALLDATAGAFPAREAIAWAPGGAVEERLAWSELRARSRLAAKRLVAAGVTKGTRVGLLCSNRTDWLPLALGAARIGAVLVPLSTLWKRDELHYALTHADVALLLTLPGFLRHDYLATLAGIVPDLRDPVRAPRVPSLRRVVVFGASAPGIAAWDDLPSSVDDAFLDALEATVSPLDPAAVFFTSGTTAQAKAVVHAHASLTISARRIADCLGIGADDAWWGHMPLFWSGGFVMGALATIAGGGRIVLHEVVEPGPALALLEAERCTIMLGWHQAAALVEHPDFARRRLFLKKGSGGTHPLAPRLLGADHVSVGMYGMTETATCITSGRWDDSEAIRTGTFGRPLAGMDVRIVDAESGCPVPPGAPGEIVVRGPTLMEGYYRVPRVETFDDEGFFHTGDLGRFDEAGCLHFASRLKDVITTAGVNVAASEVEDVLARHPAVRSAHVVGVADAARGENVAAFVVLRDDAQATPDDLRAFCRDTLASYKIPRHIFVIADADLPRTATGKIEKPALRRTAEARIATRGG
jgi:fatty-acyl-CoA synthase